MPPSSHNRRDSEQEIPIYPVHLIQDFIGLCFPSVISFSQPTRSFLAWKLCQALISLLLLFHKAFSSHTIPSGDREPRTTTSIWQTKDLALHNDCVFCSFPNNSCLLLWLLLSWCLHRTNTTPRSVQSPLFCTVKTRPSPRTPTHLRHFTFIFIEFPCHFIAQSRWKGPSAILRSLTFESVSKGINHLLWFSCPEVTSA